MEDKPHEGTAGTCTTDGLVEILHKWYFDRIQCGNINNMY